MHISRPLSLLILTIKAPKNALSIPDGNDAGLDASA